MFAAINRQDHRRAGRRLRFAIHEEGLLQQVGEAVQKASSAKGKAHKMAEESLRSAGTVSANQEYWQEPIHLNSIFCCCLGVAGQEQLP